MGIVAHVEVKFHWHWRC